MRFDLQRLPIRSILLTNIRFATESILILGINRDSRSSTSTGSRHASRDMLELGITVAMTSSLARFAVGLKGKVKRAQDLENLGAPDRISLCTKFLLKIARAFACPAKW
jgi:hypothetical protein